MRTSPAVRGLGTAALLALLIAGAIAYARSVPRAVAASAPANVFSAERAMRHVRAMAERPHQPGSADHARVRDYLLSELRGLGLSPEVQATTGIGTRYAVAGRVENVVVRVPGQQAGGAAVLLMAHYDGVPAGPAAGDDASGSAVLLETLRALRAGLPHTHDVIALFTDAEELGLLGAAAFVREHPWAKDAAVVLNFEARGSSGPSMMFETGPGNLDAVRVLRTMPGVRGTSMSTEIYRRMPNDTDLSELMMLGRPALNFAFIDHVDRYHTARDDVAGLDPRSVQDHGDEALALVRDFASGPLPRPVTPDAVFFNVPALGLIVYPVSRAVPIAILACLIVLCAMVRARVAEPRAAGGIAIGVVVMAISTALAMVVGFITASALAAWHTDRANGGASSLSGAYAAAIALFAFALVATGYGIARRWGQPRSVVVGALVVWAVIATWVAIVAPGVSFFFTWPLTAAAAAAAAFVRSERVEVALRWVAAIVALVIVAPTTYLMTCVGLGVDQTGGPLLAGLTALAFWLLAPQLEAMASGRRWVPPVAGAGLGLCAIALGGMTVRADPDHLDGASLVYVVEPDSGRAWLTGAAANGLARRWLGEATGPSRDANAPWPEWVGTYVGDKRIAKAPVVPATPSAPSATIVADSSVGGMREVTLRVQGVPGAFGLLMNVRGAAVSGVTIDGRPVRTDRYRRGPRLWPLQYVAPPDSGFVLALALPPGAHATLRLEARVPGIPSLPGMTIPPRPVGVVPVQGGDMTVRARTISLEPGVPK